MYHKLTIEETLKTLDVNPETGLSDKEAAARIAESKDSSKDASFISLFIKAMARHHIYILLFAALGAFIFGETFHALTVLCATLFHGILSAELRRRGKNCLDRSVNASVTYAIVLRNGAKMKVKSDELVVGDVVTIKPGRVIPADLRLITSDGLITDETALTGFSHCEKDCNDIIDSDVKAEARTNCAFEGTVVIKGRGDGVVIATGMSTEMSMLTLPLDVPEKKMSPRFRRLGKNLKVVTAIIYALAMVMFFAGFIRRDDLAVNVITTAALIAACIPDGIITAVLSALADGAKRLKEDGFSVKSINEVEHLGEVSVLVTDMPRIGVVATYTNGRIRTPQEEDTVPFLDGLLLCDFKNPSLKKFATHKCNAEEIIASFPRTGELSGEVTTTLHRAGNTTISYSGGEPWDILVRSKKIWDLGKVRTLTEGDREEIDEAMRTLLEEGYSLTAVGMRFGDDSPCDTGLIFLGIAATCAEEKTATSINAAAMAEAGVRVYLLTEEDAEKARLGARALSIPSESLLCGRDVSNMEDKELAARLSDTFTFAGLRVRDKVRIINLLKSYGKTVAAVGDGVTDAPVLEAADVGISDIHARDIAKDAAGVLLEGKESPEKAIYRGKIVRANIRKSTAYVFATSFALLACLVPAVLCGFSFPLTPLQLIILSMLPEVVAPIIIQKSKRLSSKGLLRSTYAVGILSGLAAAAAFRIFLSNGIAICEAQWFTFLMISGLELLMLLPLCLCGRKNNGK